MDLAKYTIPELKAVLKELHMSTGGSKTELMARLSEIEEETVRKLFDATKSKGEISDSGKDADNVNNWKAEALSMRALIEQLSSELKTLRQVSSGKDFSAPGNSSCIAPNISSTVAATTTPNCVTTPQRNVFVPVSSVVSVSQTTTAPVTTQSVFATYVVADTIDTQQQQMFVPVSNVVSVRQTTPVSVATQNIVPNFSTANMIHTPSVSQQTYLPEIQQQTTHYDHDIQRQMGTITPTATHMVGQSQSVRDIAGILPDFDPANEAYSSTQFIDRIEQLNEVYNWNEAVLLFAVMGKFKGVAKAWVDAQPVFRSWREFVSAFVGDFPCAHSAADTHIIMMNTKMGKSEKIIDYYYKMLALGRRGGIDDVSIIQYIINGQVDYRLKYSLSLMKFNSCAELLQSIMSFSSSCANLTGGSSRIPDSGREERAHEHKLYEQNAQAKRRNINDTNRGYSGPVCYNCRNRGHISRNCPQPRRSHRPNEKINKISNDTVEKKENSENMKQSKEVENTEAQVNSIAAKKPKELIKQMFILEIRPIPVSGLIDSGSSKSLIKRSIAMRCRAKIEQCQESLTGFGGGKLICAELKSLKIKIDDQTYWADFLMVDDSLMSYDILIGLDVLSMGTVLIKNGECQMLAITDAKIDIGTEVKREHLIDFNELVNEYNDCFGEKLSELGRAKNFDMVIRLSSSKIINLPAYNTPFPKRRALEDVIDELLGLNIIRPSDSLYASPIVMVKKQNGEERMCIDFREINKITEKQPWSMPTVDNVLASLGGKRYFTTLDMMSGYYQIGVEENSKQYTAFVTHYGHFEFNRMPFGLRNAPCVFQRMMSKLIAPMGNRIVSYVDEIIIATNTMEENLDELEEFLQIVKAEGLTLRVSKCSFLKTSVEFLGHIVDANGIRPGRNKTLAIYKFPQPKNPTEVRRFLGLAGFFRKFVAKFAHIAKPLTKLTKKDVDFMWSDECNEAFTKLIAILTSEPVLAMYDANAEHQLHTDASSTGIAAILLQSVENQLWHPIAYFSRCCTATEKNYHAYELEIMAVVESCERFRVFLIGKYFKIFTDCQAISTAKTTKPMLPRVARWLYKLAEYDYDVEYRSGETMRHVDALSRAPMCEEDEKAANKVMSIGTEDWVAAMQRNDAKIKNIVDVLQNVAKSAQEKQIRVEYLLKNHRLFRKNKDATLALVVPKGMRWRLVKLFHDDVGHVACEGVLERMKKQFWFPRMRNFVKGYLQSCIECTYHREPKRKQAELFGAELPKLPFEVLHLDHLGPFIKSRRGNEYVLVCVDALTRYTILYPTKSTNTKPVIDALTQLTSYFGLPKVVVTDRGSAFTSNTFSTFCNNANIYHSKVAVRTPRANGIAERINQSIITCLKTVASDPKHWDEHLREIQWALNTKKNSTTKFASMDLIFDFPLRDITGNKLLQALHDDVEVAMNTRREEARRNVERARMKWKSRFDAKHAKPIKYNEGELVVIESPSPATGESKKLLPKYKGPYVVSKILRFDRYVVQDIDGQQRSQRRYNAVVTADKMKPWCGLFPEIDDVEDDGYTRDELESGEAELS